MSRVLPDRGVVESTIASGVGNEVREEEVEIGLVGTVGSECGCV